MGFNIETPQDRVYTMKTHVENLTALIDELVCMTLRLSYRTGAA